MKDLRKNFIFLIIFGSLGFIFLQVPVFHLMGASVSFTLFDFFAPLAGAFIGPLWGVVTVLLVELINFFLKHTPATTGAVIRLFPTLFAVYYFAIYSRKKSQSRLTLLVPAIAITAFIAHPIGRTVWYFALFWLIPFIGYLRRDNLYLRSLGATFTAHAVGGAAWIWAFNLKAVVWKSLIPVVIQERLLFAAGIAVFYVVIKHILAFLMEKNLLPKLDLKLAF